ncbi:dihydrolipoamide acetyltransferase family protein [Natrinema sp. 1APR25-10V2]|uniref:dihydrolipoamide acetyltransferase family protein n=1 Tax=Natrinema sp. 1APR25-10V2 TaxID=2951081 RepID=UPI002873F9F8|nr:dihydrolipoamide acetyltransferase family protein [Natrinema sp. 1APR25-10V2]MDS0476989.1 2-oxo acid dehydrogenase subunit E2 [Natrinema sp. 1APR25-10V2]
MVEVVRIPKLGLSDYGDLVSWEVDEGDRVTEGEIVAVLESDKASAEIEASASGTLLAQYVEEGEEIAIEVGKPLAVIGEEDEQAPSLSELEGGEESSEPVSSGESTSDTDADSAKGAEANGGSAAAEVKATPRAKRRANEEDIDLVGIDGTGPQGAVTESDVEEYLESAEAEPAAGGEVEPADDGDGSEASASTDVKATPRAKRRAEEAGVDLTRVEGTGPQGAITESDVEEFTSRETGSGAEETTGASEEATAGGLTVTESRELTGARKTIAERLSESAREKPHVMGTRDIGIERLEEVRDRLEEKGVDVSLNDLILHFVGRTLEDLPEFNAHFEDGEHRLIDEVNVGYAVDSERGLMVPVIDDVPGRDLEELASERRRLVEAVLENEHAPSDIQGGTFTVTNVGVFDMDVSYSIINPPEVAILALGRRKPIPVERDGEVDFERAITFSLTIDHRVLDGADSGAFLDRLAEYLEYPGRAFDAV